MAICSALFADSLSQLRKLDRDLEFIKKKTDSMIFISDSFRQLCKGRGFSSFEEWGQVCKELWQLESIEWKPCDNSENEITEIYCGTWSGVYGSGQVYARKGEKLNESKN